jgi:hypothetical protein
MTTGAADRIHSLVIMRPGPNFHFRRGIESLVNFSTLPTPNKI